MATRLALVLTTLLAVVVGCSPRSSEPASQSELRTPTTLAHTQPLADRVPDDAMIYFGWRGTDNVGDAYQQSHLKAFVDASDWRQFFHDFLPAVTEKVGQQNPDAAEALQLLSSISSPAWRYESAFYFGGMIAGQRNGPPSPKLALLIRAGADAPAVARQIEESILAAGHPPFPVKVEAYHGLVAVTTGAWPAFEALLGAQNNAPAAPALKSNPKFTAALAQVQKDAVATVYVDAEAIVKMIDGFNALGAPPEQQRMWRRIRQILGLGSLRQFAFTGGFDGKDWVGTGFLAAPAPRQGLVAMMDPTPISDDILKLIPRDVNTATAARADFAKLLSQAKSSVATTAPDWSQNVNQFLAMANQFAGLDLERDLLGPLGDQWAAYSSPVVGGNNALGVAIVNHPRDPQKLEASLGILEKRITDIIARQTQGRTVVAFKTKQSGDLTLHYLALPFVTPTWTIADGNLYVAFYPQIVVSAANYTKHNGPTILQNAKFAATRKRLGNQQASAVSFADLPRTAPNAYASWLFLTRYVGFADLFGIDSPLMLLPPIDRLLPELTPAGSISWTDDAGWHCKSVTPFPGAGTLAQDPLSAAMTAQPALAASVLLPSLNRARETANRVKSASNLRQIGQGMLLYANEHKGKYPATLGEVFTTQDIPVDAFVSPSSNTTPPRNAADREKVAEWINESSDFVYMGSGKTSSAGPEEILAYEKPDIHGKDGFNVLFGDGHVEFVTRDAGLNMVRQQEAKDKQAK